MLPTNRIVFDYGHRGSHGVRRDMEHAKPKRVAPPPPKWTCDPVSPFGPLFEQSILKSHRSGDKAIEIITVSDSPSPPHFMEYNHGMEISMEKHSHKLNQSDKNNSNSDCFVPNPLYQFKPSPSKIIMESQNNISFKTDVQECNKRRYESNDIPITLLSNSLEIVDDGNSNREISKLESEKLPSVSEVIVSRENSSVPASTSIDLKISVHEKHLPENLTQAYDANGTVNAKVVTGGGKRKNSDCEKENVEDIIGRKISKARVSTSSRLYAKPSRKLVSGSLNNGDPIPQLKEPERDNIVLANNSELPVTEETPNEAESDLFSCTRVEGHASYSAGNVENIVIDICPYDIVVTEENQSPSYNILQIEEELRMMEDETFCPINQVEYHESDLSYPMIKIREDIWETYDTDAASNSE